MAATVVGVCDGVGIAAIVGVCSSRTNGQRHDGKAPGQDLGRSRPLGRARSTSHHKLGLMCEVLGQAAPQGGLSRPQRRLPPGAGIEL